MRPRCYLFVPGDRGEMLAKASARGADALIIDLEDAVAPTTRAAAFATVAEWLRDSDEIDQETWVRLPGGCSSGDAAPVINAGIAGVVVPKVRSAADIATFGEVLAETGSAVSMIALIETALGLQQVDAIAAVPGVVRLMSGEVDMAAELGVDPDDDLAWRPIRSRIVVASAAARLVGPIGPVSVDYSNPETLSARARMLRRQGFRAGAAIHPNQIDPYLRGYARDPEEIAAARQVIERYEMALAEGRGTVVDNAGHMVDEATVKGARRLIEEG